jgi:predicted anti-sigma-YlaC factor YlaD
MNCQEIRELLPDITTSAGMAAASIPEAAEHLASCAACATHLRELQNTMALLDEWQAPEPSPYFDTRMQARLREEMARPQAASLSWLSWMRRPAWAMSLAAVVFAGALTIGMVGKSYIVSPEAIKTEPPSLSLPVQPGTAVGDLQALERNDELYADFDVLDQLQVQDDVTANP